MLCYIHRVSIHRPHTRPDLEQPAARRLWDCFNSQASYEARPSSTAVEVRQNVFQFTGLIRGPTRVIIRTMAPFGVSIHRPHTRPDFSSPHIRYTLICFNSQASYEARLRDQVNILPDDRFNSQASYEARHSNAVRRRAKQEFQFTGLIRGPTSVSVNPAAYSAVSIHRPHTRPDLFTVAAPIIMSSFQFTGLIRGPTV